MSTYVIHYNDTRGDLVDIEYFDSLMCMSEKLDQIAPDRGENPGAGEYTFPDGASISWGAWPGGSETDSDVYCATCGDLMWNGLEHYSSARDAFVSTPMAQQVESAFGKQASDLVPTSNTAPVNGRGQCWYTVFVDGERLSFKTPDAAERCLNEHNVMENRIIFSEIGTPSGTPQETIGDEKNSQFEPLSKDELYGWVIIEDLINGGMDKGIRGGTLDEGLTVDFQLFDDDGILYYSGLMTPSCLNNYGQGFGNPLDDFGTPNAGATTLKYSENGGRSFKVL